MGEIDYDSEYNKVMTGSITANGQSVDISGGNSGTKSVQITGTFVGTMVIEVSDDQSVYQQVSLLKVGTFLFSTTMTTTGYYIAPVSAGVTIRVTSTAWSSGTATITSYGTDSASIVFAHAFIKGGTDGTAIGNVSDRLKANTTVTDGTDTQGVTTNGDAKVVDGLRNGGVFGALNIPTINVAVEAKVGGARLAQRKALIITIENNGIFWGLDNTVTTTNGVSTSNGQVLTFSIDPDSTFQIWLVGNANNKNVHVVEVP